VGTTTPPTSPDNLSVRNNHIPNTQLQIPELGRLYLKAVSPKQYSFLQIPTSLIVGDNNISDNTGSKHFGKFSGHSLSNSQIKTVNSHSQINKSA